MKARSYGLWVLSAALVVSMGLAVRTAYSMAPTQEAQQPAEPDVAFVDPGNQTSADMTTGQHGATSTQVKGGSNGTTQLRSGPSPANSLSPAIQPGMNLIQLATLARLLNIWAASLYNR